MTRRSGLTAVGGLVLSSQMLLAGDASYQETTRITGGSMVSMMKYAGAFNKNARKLDEPMVTTVAVKGNRMARSTADYIDITDLDAQTMTHIDRARREYTVTTFEQMKQAVEDARQRAQGSGTAEQPADKPGSDASVKTSFDAHVRKTGASKVVSGLNTSEIILTLAVNGTDMKSGQQGAMAITSDMWMAPEVPGQAEVREFEVKLAKALGTGMMGQGQYAAMMQQAQASEGMRALAKEMSQIQGTPVLQVMRMGMSANGKPLPAASEAPLPAAGAGAGINQGDSSDALSAQVAQATANAGREAAAQETSQRVGGALGSGLGSAIGGFGGLGGFGRKKKSSAPAATPAPAPTDAPTETPVATPAEAGPGAGPKAGDGAVLMESTTELSSFSDRVDAGAFSVPAGYKQVERRR